MYFHERKQLVNIHRLGNIIRCACADAFFPVAVIASAVRAIMEVFIHRHFPDLLHSSIAIHFSIMISIIQDQYFDAALISQAIPCRYWHNNFHSF